MIDQAEFTGLNRIDLPLIGDREFPAAYPSQRTIIFYFPVSGLDEFHCSGVVQGQFFRFQSVDYAFRTVVDVGCSGVRLHDCSVVEYGCLLAGKRGDCIFIEKGAAYPLYSAAEDFPEIVDDGVAAVDPDSVDGAFRRVFQ